MDWRQYYRRIVSVCLRKVVSLTAVSGYNKVKKTRGENMSKLIFLDVDGTLVDYHNRIPESAVKAIRQAREKGHLVYVCTGR